MKLISIPTTNDCLRLKWKPFHTASRLTPSPLPPRWHWWRRLWRSMLRKIILVSSLINTCFVTALIHSLTKSKIRSRIGIERSLSSVTKQSCIMSLALHHPPGRHSKLLNKSRTEWLCCAYISLRNELILIREFHFIYSLVCTTACCYDHYAPLLDLDLDSDSDWQSHQHQRSQAQANVRWTRCNRLDCLLRTCRYPLIWDSHRTAIIHLYNADSYHYGMDW